MIPSYLAHACMGQSFHILCVLTRLADGTSLSNLFHSKISRPFPYTAAAIVSPFFVFVLFFQFLKQHNFTLVGFSFLVFLSCSYYSVVTLCLLTTGTTFNNLIGVTLQTTAWLARYESHMPRIILTADTWTLVSHCQTYLPSTAEEDVIILLNNGSIWF